MGIEKLPGFLTGSKNVEIPIPGGPADGVESGWAESRQGDDTAGASKHADGAGQFFQVLGLNIPDVFALQQHLPAPLLAKAGDGPGQFLQGGIIEAALEYQVIRILHTRAGDCFHIQLLGI